MSRLDYIGAQFFYDNGEVLAQGSLEFFEAGGGTTPKTVYSNVSLTDPYVGPVPLDDAGRPPPIFYDGLARVVLKDRNGVQIDSRDYLGTPVFEGQFQDYRSDRTYNEGDFVVAEDGQIYVSLIDGNIGNTPETSPSAWELFNNYVLASQSVVPPGQVAVGDSTTGLRGTPIPVGQLIRGAPGGNFIGVPTDGDPDKFLAGDYQFKAIPAQSLIAQDVTTDTTLTRNNHGNIVRADGELDLTLVAANVATNGFFVIIENIGSDIVTLKSSSLIDGESEYPIYSGEVRLVQSDGSVYSSIVLHAFKHDFFTSQDVVIPPGYESFGFFLWGSGAGGHSTGGGGGGGACQDVMCIPLSGTLPLVIAAGGAVGGNGSASTFAGVTAYGGATGTSTASGAGGGQLGAASGTTGGAPSPSSFANNIGGFGGANGRDNAGDGYTSIKGGGSGALGTNAQTGGRSILGGGGGANNHPDSIGGSSVLGGKGGDYGQPGEVPAGGGATNQPGANGKLTLFGIM